MQGLDRKGQVVHKSSCEQLGQLGRVVHRRRSSYRIYAAPAVSATQLIRSTPCPHRWAWCVCGGAGIWCHHHPIRPLGPLSSHPPTTPSPYLPPICPFPLRSPCLLPSLMCTTPAPPCAPHVPPQAGSTYHVPACICTHMCRQSLTHHAHSSPPVLHLYQLACRRAAAVAAYAYACNSTSLAPHHTCTCTTDHSCLPARACLRVPCGALKLRAARWPCMRPTPLAPPALFALQRSQSRRNNLTQLYARGALEVGGLGLRSHSPAGVKGERDAMRCGMRCLPI